MKKQLGCLVFLGLLSIAEAALGGRVKNSMKPLSTYKNYSVFERKEGTVNVKEFANSSGKIFAVSWKGKTHPEIEALMGEHYSLYRESLRKAKQTQRGFGPLRVSHKNFHLELAGRMRAVQGRAWLEEEIPQGVNTYDIR